MKQVFFTIIAFISLATFGRAPAVEPITSYPIDQYKEVPPSQDPGFNWNQESYVRETSLITTRVPAQNALIQGTKSQNKTLVTTFVLLCFGAMPFVLWFSLMKALDKVDAGQGPNYYAKEKSTQPISLTEERERRRKDSEGEDISKAS